MKNALLVVVAFALGAGGVWYFTGHRTGDGAAASGPAARGPGGAGAPAGRPSAGFAGRAAAEPPLVVIGRAHREQLYDVVEALGTAQANESVTLTAKVTDTVRRVNFEDGDYVQQGAVLIELTNQEEEAALAEARANLNDAQSQLRRLEELSKRGLTAASELDVARSRADAMQARLNSVLARLRDRLILAPFSGLLGFRKVSPGTLLTPEHGDHVDRRHLDDQARLHGARDVSRGDDAGREDHREERQLPGSRVRRRRPHGGLARRSRHARRSRCAPTCRTRTASLRPGMLLTVDVLTTQHEALVVPEGAVFQVQNRAYVYRLDGQTAMQQQIEIGGRRFGVVEVLGGLQEGDAIVVEGIVKLRDGMQVRFEESGAAVSEISKEPLPAPPPGARG